MNVGQAIRLCRTQRGVSQSAIANSAKCSVSYLSMLENGVVAQMPVAAEVGSGDERDELGSG